MCDSLHDQSANAVLELAFIIPFVLFLVFVSAEAADSLHAQQYLSVVVRELSMGAYRTCMEAADGTAVNSCLETTAANVLQYAQGSEGLALDVRLNVKLYRVRFDGETSLPPGLAGEYATVPPAPSRYTLETIQNLRSYVPGKHTIVAAEASFTPPLLKTFFPAGMLYETSLL